MVLTASLTQVAVCPSACPACPACLQVADGSYAFVLHTANPLTGQLGEMFGELVPGLGEVLVSDRLTNNRAQPGESQNILAAPKHSLCLVETCLTPTAAPRVQHPPCFCQRHTMVHV